MNRSEILNTAKEYVMKDRAATHGDMENNFELIADLWHAVVHARFSKSEALCASDVAIMMGLVKVARAISNPKHEDNWIDLAGYAACGGECATGTGSSPNIIDEFELKEAHKYAIGPDGAGGTSGGGAADLLRGVGGAS